MDLKVSRHCHQNLEFSTWKIRLEIHKAKMEKLVSCIYLKEKEKKNLVPDPPTTWLCQWFKQIWCYKKNKKNKTNQNFVGGIHFNHHHPLVSEPEKWWKAWARLRQSNCWRNNRFCLNWNDVGETLSCSLLTGRGMKNEWLVYQAAH